ncbi:MAG: histidine kinase [Bacteroidales bacterium]|nr:MAG: histidine kinase [Bacteroidales bacterium]
MQSKLFIHNPLFRLLTPPFYGIMVYIFILTIFDSLYQLKENFFSYEALLIIILTFLLMEGLRIETILLDKFYKEKSKARLRVIMQFAVSFVYAAFITSAVVSAYFYFLVGYRSFLTELLVFNIIFILSAILYTMLYYSVFYLNQQNVVMLSKENILRENLEYELESFKNEINPEFLYDSLESLISLIHEDPIPAEKFIDQLSGVYRYKLESKKNELVNLKDEIEVTRDFIDILNVKYGNNIHLETGNISDLYYKMVPCTLQVFTEGIVRRNIVNDIQPLKIQVMTDEDRYLLFSYQPNDRLAPDSFHDTRDKKIIRAYEYYSDKPVVISERNELVEIKIPLLEIMEEEL